MNSFPDLSPSSKSSNTRSSIYKACRNYFTAAMMTANLENKYGGGSLAWLALIPDQIALFNFILSSYPQILNGHPPSQATFREFLNCQPSFVPEDSSNKFNFLEGDMALVASFVNIDTSPGVVEVLPSVCEDIVTDDEPLCATETEAVEILEMSPPELVIFHPLKYEGFRLACDLNQKLCSDCSEQGTMYRHPNAFEQEDYRGWCGPPKYLVTSNPSHLRYGKRQVAFVCTAAYVNDYFKELGLIKHSTSLRLELAKYHTNIRAAIKVPHAYAPRVRINRRYDWKPGVDPSHYSARPLNVQWYIENLMMEFNDRLD